MATKLQNDLTDCSSFLFHSLELLDEQAKEWERKAARLREFNRMLVYNIQEGRIADDETFNCALAWFAHSPTADPEWCIKKSLEES